MKFLKVKSVRSPELQSCYYNLYIPEDFNNKISYRLTAGTGLRIPSGLKIQPEEGHLLIPITPNNLLNSKIGQVTMPSRIKNNKYPGLEVIYGSAVCITSIDVESTEEIIYNIINTGTVEILIEPNMLIMQMVEIPVRVDEPQELKPIKTIKTIGEVKVPLKRGRKKQLNK